MLVASGTHQCRPERRLARKIARGNTLGGAEAFQLLSGFEFGLLPTDHRVGRDHLNRLTEPRAESRHQIRVPLHDSVHRVVQPARIDGSGHREVQLHRIDIREGRTCRGTVRTCRNGGVKQQSLLHRRERQHVCDTKTLRQLVELALSQPGGQDVGRGQPATAGAHVSADTHECLKPQPAQPLNLDRVYQRRRPCPDRL
ncbi:Uncharacterised protein [Mycobacteroides abscessus subsp. abscessus]|nr:Uncharacterised protein [Mycobacteroides abscessus subsp. abscessus]SHW79706.1 Uncharacterised protein [Mycobacteroides abscessus subsp. abscessus]